MAEERSSMDALAFDLRKPEEVKEYMNHLRIEYQYQCYKEKLGDGCHRLGDFHEAFQKDLSKARSVYEHACNTHQFPLSCYKHANYAQVGKAGPKDVQQALKHYKIGCEKDHLPSCNAAALIYQSKELDKPDFLSAEKYFKIACDKNHVESCNLLSAYYIRGKPGIPRDMEKAFTYAEKCCNAGHIYACANISVMYKKGEGVNKDLKLAEQYKQRAKELHRLATEPERTIEFGK